MMHINISDYKYNGNITIWVHCGFTSIQIIFITFTVKINIVDLIFCSSFRTKCLNLAYSA